MGTEQMGQEWESTLLLNTFDVFKSLNPIFLMYLKIH